MKPGTSALRLPKAARIDSLAVAGRGPRIAARARAVAAVLACTLLGGCALLGGGGDRESTSIYAPDPRIAPEASWPTVQWQLTISPATAARMLDSTRIAVQPTPGEMQVYRGARWSKPPTQMLEDAILRGLEDSGRIAAVARQGSGIDGDYRLLMDLRRFDADYAGAAVPTATIEVNAKLLHPLDQQVVASRTFVVRRAAAGTAVAQVADAFDTALGDIAGQLAGWTLASGERHEHAPR